jgi:hypothetical protein
MFDSPALQCIALQPPPGASAAPALREPALDQLHINAVSSVMHHLALSLTIQVNQVQ